VEHSILHGQDHTTVKSRPLNRVGFLLLFLLAGSSAAQPSPWYLTRGGSGLDQAWGVDVDSAGSIYLAVSETPFLSWYFDICLYKFSPEGREIWRSQRWGGPFNDKAFITVVQAPCVYVAGRTDSSGAPGSGEAVVLAYDIARGGLLWEYTWGRGYGYEEVDGLVAADDGIYISGWTEGPSSQMDIFLQKLNYAGKLEWSSVWGSPGFDEANGQIVLDDSTVYVAGRYNGGELLGGDVLLAAFDRKDGSYRWHTTWGGTIYQDAYGMTQQGPYLYLVGIKMSQTGGSQILLLKATKSGRRVWETLWGGDKGESARAVAVVGDSLVYVTGKTDSYGAGGNDVVLIKCDTNGNVRSFKTWGGSGTDEAHGMATYGEFIYIAGETGSGGAGKQDALLLKAKGNTMEMPELPVTRVEARQTVEAPLDLEAFPNPFNPLMMIRFSLKVREHVALRVFDALGREVREMVNRELERGDHAFVLDATDMRSGVYLCRLQGPHSVEVKTLVVVK